jgi:hypothetical protein
MRTTLLLLSCGLWGMVVGQANCVQTSVGFTPINDLGTGTYLGMMGGLYPNGSNARPQSHQDAGLAFAQQVQPLDPLGTADPVDGKVVWLSIGFSNATQETQAFIPLATALPDLDPHLVLVDGAQGGQTADILSTPSNPNYASYWNTVGNRLANAGVTDQQVQAIWLKDDDQANGTPIEEHSDSLLMRFKRITHELHTRFPNAHLCYVASRIYGGYASTELNPEPYAYRNGWTMKQLIGNQIAGDPELQFAGPEANSPWLSWGVYLWADGTTPRSDGLTWICPDDFQDDGTHPSLVGRDKVAHLLLDFFTTDSTSCSWFLSDCGVSTGVQAAAAPGLSITPNPARTSVTIQHGLSGTVNLVVFDALGAAALSTTGSGSTITIAADGLAPGIYTVVLHASDGRVQGRLVIAGEEE